jgi:hypothetical protein
MQGIRTYKALNGGEPALVTPVIHRFIFFYIKNVRAVFVIDKIGGL